MLRGDVPGLRVPVGGWWLKSILVNGRELLDARIDLRQSAADAVATFSDQASEISGRVTDAQQAPLTAQRVLVFSTDQSAWFFNSRRIAAVRTDADGRYVVRNLPPGEYRIAVTTELEPGEWFDPDILARLPGTTVTIAGVETQTQDLVITPGSGLHFALGVKSPFRPWGQVCVWGAGRHLTLGEFSRPDPKGKVET
jgi:hypothetical protein